MRGVMKRKKRFYLPLRAYLLYLFLICFALTGVTFARYTTSSRGSDTARVAKISDLKITENGDFYEPGIFPVAPGADIQKDICVSFEGSEAACYAFLRLRCEGFSRTELTHYTYTDAQSGAQWLSFDVSTEDWTVLSEGRLDRRILRRRKAEYSLCAPCDCAKRKNHRILRYEAQRPYAPAAKAFLWGGCLCGAEQRLCRGDGKGAGARRL